MIRKARITEARAIREISNIFATKGILLPLSLSEIYAHIRDFFVFIEDNLKDNVILDNYLNIAGISSLNIIWEDLAEVRSLAVREEHWRKGIGTELVKACIQEASNLGIKKIFCLTYNKEFFTTLGFKEIEKSQLPHKIWADCLKCSKFPDCIEIAMIFEI